MAQIANSPRAQEHSTAVCRIPFTRTGICEEAHEAVQQILGSDRVTSSQQVIELETVRRVTSDHDAPSPSVLHRGARARNPGTDWLTPSRGTSITLGAAKGGHGRDLSESPHCCSDHSCLVDMAPCLIR